MEWPALAQLPLKHAMRAMGIDAVYDRVGFSSFPVRGVFDAAYNLVTLDPGTGIPVSSVRPVFSFRLADTVDTPLAGGLPLTGDSVIIGAVTYKVVDIHPDGQGGVLLVLKV